MSRGKKHANCFAKPRERESTSWTTRNMVVIRGSRKVIANVSGRVLRGDEPLLRSGTIENTLPVAEMRERRYNEQADDGGVLGYFSRRENGGMPFDRRILR